MTSASVAAKTPIRAGYMSELDGVRGLAILAVILWHFEPWSSQAMPWGQIGVRLFFVLGCFLVTAGLLRARDRVAAGTQSIGAAAKAFYVGRYIRLVPMYWLTLIVVAALGYPSVRDNFLWHFFFATNLFIGFTKQFPPDSAHFWFLGVQEQIYLVWPWLVLALSRRALIWVILACIVEAPLYRLAIMHVDPYFWYFASPFANLDSIACGALIAWLRHSKDGTALARLTGPGTGWIALALFAFGCSRAEWPFFPGPITETALSLSFAWAVARAATGFGGAIGAALAGWPLRGTGVVSYGLYIFHPLVAPGLLALGLYGPTDTYARLVLATAVSYALATAAYYAIEKPIANFKRARRA
jgi:peptidoglycan/LPS O-acetylase OafA/YrhL